MSSVSGCNPTDNGWWTPLAYVSSLWAEPRAFKPQFDIDIGNKSKGCVKAKLGFCDCLVIGFQPVIIEKLERPYGHMMGAL